MEGENQDEREQAKLACNLEASDACDHCQGPCPNHPLEDERH